MKKRPFAITILAILAAVAGVLAAFHLLQALGIFPYVIGAVSIRDFNLWYVITWALMLWVWAWVFTMLWNVDPRGWMFLMFIAAFNLIFDFVAMLGATTSFSDVALSFLVNGLILAYLVLPGTKEAFGVPNT